MAADAYATHTLLESGIACMKTSQNCEGCLAQFQEKEKKKLLKTLRQIEVRVSSADTSVGPSSP